MSVLLEEAADLIISDSETFCFIPHASASEKFGVTLFFSGSYTSDNGNHTSDAERRKTVSLSWKFRNDNHLSMLDESREIVVFGE